MPSIAHRRRSSSISDAKPKFNKAAVIGGAVGGVYTIIFILLIVIWIRRRRKKRRVGQEQENNIVGRYNQSLEFNSFFDGPPPSRSLVMTEQSYRPPTRKFGHRKVLSDGTVMRGTSSNPFWMFKGTYDESENGSIHHRRRSESSISFVVRPRTALSSHIHMPTSIFVAEMNAKYPHANVRPRTSSKSIENSTPRIRQVPRSPSPSSSIFQEEAYLPPIPIHPLLHKDSIDRIVSVAMEKSRVVEDNTVPELIGVGTLSKGQKRKIVHVAHSKSISALSERFLMRMRKSKKGVLEDVEQE